MIPGRQTPKEAFDAINNPRIWWSEEIEGSTDKVNDEFTYHYKDVHFGRIRVIEVLPNERVTWLVLENSFNFIEDDSEWIGTNMTLAVSTKGDQTEVAFAHLGLVPEHECFDVCSNAWSTYINGSLPQLIRTGRGQPNPKE